MPRTLFLGTPFERYEQTHLLERVSDLPELTRSAREAAQAEEIDLVCMTNVSPTAPRYPAWIAAGFVALPSFPDMVVDLKGIESFDAHLARIPPGDRSSVRRNIRKFEKAGLKLSPVRPEDRLGASLWEGYVPFFDRARVKWIPHSPAYFRGISEVAREVSLTTARTAEGQLAGFILNFADGLGWHAGRIGVLPTWERRDSVYFRLIYHLVEEAIANNASQLSLEPTCYRMKRHLGAHYRPLVNLVYGIHPLWRLMLATLQPVAQLALGHLTNHKQLEKWY